MPKLEKPTQVEVDENKIFEGLHVDHAVLDKYVHDKLHMLQKDRKEVENHLLHFCPHGDCQRVIDSIVEEDGKRNRAGLPRGDY